MIVGIQGTRAFTDYSNIFMRSMLRALSLKDSEDKEFIIYSAGPKNINDMAMEYINVSDFKRYGIKARFQNVPPSWIKSNMSELDIFFYFCLPKENRSDLLNFLERKDIKTEIYRY